MNLDRVTDSHVELNVLDDMQEFLSNGLHKISFDYDEDTAIIKILKQELSVTICTVNTWYYLKLEVTQILVLCKIKDFLAQALMSL
jgi:hypothetical protein